MATADHIQIPEDATEARKETVVGSTPTTVFDFPWPYFNAADIKVYVDGTLVTTGYTLTPTTTKEGGFVGGEVEFAVAKTNCAVILERDIALARQDDFEYPSSNKLNIRALNTTFDRIFGIFQQFRRLFKRTLRTPIGDTLDLDELPVAAERAGLLLGFDADGQLVVRAENGGAALDIPISIALGGTGANTAAGARTALGLGALAIKATVAADDESDDPWTTLASASTCAIGGQNSRNVEITGTTTITSFGTIAAGRVRNLRFAGALTLTHHATSLICKGGASITTAAGDTCQMISLGSGNWEMVDYQRANGQALVAASTLAKPQSATYVTNADLTTPIPVDDTVPQQSTDGTEIVTVSITPSSASNKVRVRAYFYGQGNVSVSVMVGAIFRDSGASALTGGIGYARSTATNTAMGAFIEVVDSPATTSSVTYKLRVGPDAGTMRLNGGTGGRLFGGALTVGIFVEEVPV